MARHRGMNLKETKVYWVADEVFIQAVQESSCIKDALALMACTPSTHFYEALRLRCKELNIDPPVYQRNNFLKEIPPLEAILIQDSSYSRSSLKKRLIQEGLLENKCYIEGCPTNEIPGEWNGLPLVFQMDHINGINNDNRLENLRMLCPNCHTQTETYCGKSNTGRIVNPNKEKNNKNKDKDECPGECSNLKSKRAKLCF